MSCYRPNLLLPLGIPKENFESWQDPTERFKFIPNTRVDDDMLVNADAYGFIRIPCGKCLGCRLDYSRAWADRMMLELETAKKGLFVTLTYNDEHIHTVDFEDSPICYTLDKRDVQLFMKNLRRMFDGKDNRPAARIRFFAAGEYGPTGTHRPHIHLILFGIGLEDLPLRFYQGVNELGQAFYRSPELEFAWSEFEGKGKSRRRVESKGFVTVSDVSWNTCAYVARYVVKKVLDTEDGFSPVNFGALEEFTLMSRRPGIGAEYLEQHPDCLDYQRISLPSKDGARSISIPKYYLRSLELTDPEKYAKLIEQRKAGAMDSMLSELSRTSLSYIEQLGVNEKRRKKSMKALKRNLA